jgi:putative transcriptional regulator
MPMIVVRLDRVLADRKMTLKQLSERTGISDVNLSRLKNGHIKAIRFSTLNAICTELKCQPRDILEFFYDL